MADWDAIRKEYETTDLVMKELAEKHGVKYTTLRSRKSREKWQKTKVTQHQVKSKKKSATQQKKNVATKKESVATQKAKNVADGNKELKDWEIAFCYEYLKEFNATKAYRTVRPGVAYSTANVEGSKTLAKPSIQKAIADIKIELSGQSFIELADIKREYEKQAFANINDFVEFGIEEITLYDDEDNPIFDEYGNIKTYKRPYVHFKDQDEIDGTLVQEIKKGRDGPIIKLYDKQRAMQQLQRLTGDATERELELRLLELQVRQQEMELQLIEADMADDEEFKDDGFIDALNHIGGDVWQDDAED